MPRLLVLATFSVLCSIGLVAQTTSIVAIQGPRPETVQWRPIDNGTIVFRDVLIAAVGANAAVPPGATVIAGKGLTVYPGLIDMGTTTGIEMPPTPRAENPQTIEDIERVKADY